MDFDRRGYSFDYSDPPPRSPRVNYAIVLLVALMGGLLGGAAMAYFAPQYLYGKVLPWPENMNNPQNVVYELPRSLDYTDSEDASVKHVVITENLENRITAVAETVGPAVVGVANRGLVTDWFGNTSMADLGSGSGLIIDPQGLIVTNHHVIAKATEVYVNLVNGAKLKAEIVGSDEWTDLAVLQINLNDLPDHSRELPYVVFGDSSKVKVGQTAIAIGNPLGIDFARTVTAGIISAVDRIINVEGHQYSLLQTDAAINSGNSGGPLLDISGNVIGINQSKIASTGVEGLGFAIPSEQARPIIEQIVQYGKVIRPYLGISGVPLNNRYARYLRIEVNQGIYIESVVGNSPAAKAGIQARDIIVEMDGETITSFTSLQRVLYRHHAGDIVEVKIYRPDAMDYKTVMVTLEVLDGV